MEVIREIKVWQQQVKWKGLWEDGVRGSTGRRTWKIAALGTVHFEEAKHDFPRNKPVLPYRSAVPSCAGFSFPWCVWTPSADAVCVLRPPWEQQTAESLAGEGFSLSCEASAAFFWCSYKEPGSLNLLWNCWSINTCYIDHLQISI